MTETTLFEGQTLTIARRAHVLEVALNRAPCNEIGEQTLIELEHLVGITKEEAHADRSRALLIYSRQQRGFSAGADLRSLYIGLTDARESGQSAHADIRSFVDRIHAVFSALDESPLTTVGALHGVVFGGGFELALTCDILIADRTARFAFPELRLGLVPGFGGIPRLARDVGNSVVRDILFLGRSIGAARAYELGLVSQLVSRGEALDVARQAAEQAALFHPEVRARAKRFAKTFPTQALLAEKELFLELIQSSRVHEALGRFVHSTDVRPYLPDNNTAGTARPEANA